MKTNYSKAGIDKDSVTKRVLIELRRKIIQGVYPSGSRLLETELAAAFETSRGTIRNTMQELSGEGLVEFLDSGGCVVIGINEKSSGIHITSAGCLKRKQPIFSCLPATSAIQA